MDAASTQAVEANRSPPLDDPHEARRTQAALLKPLGPEDVSYRPGTGAAELFGLRVLG